MCAMDEYARTLLILFWKRARMFPAIIDTNEIKANTRNSESDFRKSVCVKYLSRMANIAPFDTVAMNAATGGGAPS